MNKKHMTKQDKNEQIMLIRDFNNIFFLIVYYCIFFLVFIFYTEFKISLFICGIIFFDFCLSIHFIWVVIQDINGKKFFKTLKKRLNYKISFYKRNRTTFGYNALYKDKTVVGINIYNIFKHECKNSLDTLTQRIIHLILQERICLEFRIHDFNYKKFKLCKHHKEYHCGAARIADLMLKEK